MTTLRVVRVSLVDRLLAYSDHIGFRLVCMVLLAGVLFGGALVALLLPVIPSWLLKITAVLFLLELALIYDCLFVQMPRMAEVK